jgi:hypothetical protein
MMTMRYVIALKDGRFELITRPFDGGYIGDALTIAKMDAKARRGTLVADEAGRKVELVAAAR